ncbi:MAG TPA: PAS domain S-box protein [Flavobacterium sp.]|jgi:PAS domain S-box-containing protein
MTNDNVSILIFESDEHFTDLTKKILNAAGISVEIHTAASAEGFKHLLSIISPDVVLIGIIDAEPFCCDAVSYSKECHPHLPVIVLTPSADDLVLKAYRCGADDSVFKDRMHTLPPTLLNAIRNARLRQESETSTAKLALSEQRFRTLIESGADAIAIMNCDGNLTYVSSSIKTLLGYDESEALQLHLSSVIHPDDAHAVAEKLAECIATPGIPMKGQTARIKHKNGEWRWLEATLTNMFHDPTIGGIVDNFRDVTDQKIAEEKLIYANRLYSFISQINQSIVQVREPETLFELACKISVTAGGFAYAWIGLADPEGQTIQMAASAGGAEIDQAFFKNYRYDIGGPIHKVLQGKDYSVVTDIRNHKNQLFIDYATGRGFNSAISLSLRQHHKVIGTINLYSTEKHFFTEQEIELLTEVSSDISFALDVFDNERLRIETEKTLKHNNIILNHAQALARLGSFELNLSTGVAVWSNELLRIYGIPSSQKQQNYESWLSHIHPEDRDEVRRITSAAASTHTDCSFSHRIIRMDGDIRNIDSKANFEFDEEGKPVALIGIGKDVTEFTDTMQALHASEDAFKKSELRYQQIIELAQEGIWVMNKKGETVFTNQKVSDIMKYPAGELLGKDIFAFVDNSNKKTAARNIQMWMGGKSDKFDICLKSKDGASVWVQMTSSLIKDDRGDSQGLITLLFDITERKKAEDDARFKANLLNTIGQAVIATDLNGNITYWNKAAHQLYGWKASEVIGQNVVDLIPTDQTREEAQEIMRQLSSGKSWSGQFNVRRKNGETFPAHVTDSPIYDRKNRLKGVIGISTDISEQKQLKRMLERVNRHAGYGTWEANMLRSTLYWSDITKDIHEVPADYTPDIQKAISFYRPGENRKAITQALKLAMEEGQPWDVELEIITAQGNSRWVRSMGEAEFSGQRCIKIYGSFQDIHHRKLIELESTKLLQEKNIILESLGDSIFVVDKDWMVTYCSNITEDFLRIGHDNVIGKNIWEIFPDAINTVFEDQYRTAIAEKKSVIFEGFYEPFNKKFLVNAYPGKEGLTIFFKDVSR